MPSMFTATGLALFGAGALSSLFVVAGVLQFERRSNRVRQSEMLASSQTSTEKLDDVELHSSALAAQ